MLILSFGIIINCILFLFMKNNKNVILAYVLVLVLLFSISQNVYAKYIINEDMDIQGKSSEFYFDVISNEENIVKFVNNKAEFDFSLKNNNGIDFNDYNVTYEISLINNSKYTFSVGGESPTDETLTLTLNGNQTIDENKVIEIVPKENAVVKLSENAEIKIKAISPYVKEYSFPITIVENKEFAYDYSGTTEVFTAPISGKYKIELWGAEGGAFSGTTFDGVNITIPSSKGAYTSGIIDLTKNEQLNLTVGGKGGIAATSETLTAGGFNGGGGTYYKAGTGGGATDIRYGGTTLNDRIMVAAGAGGSAVRSTALIGGAGGTFVGISGGNSTTADYQGMHAGRGGTQIAGGQKGELWTGAIRENRYQGTDGAFGNAGKGGYELSYEEGSGGGGGGYYGGGRRL